MLPEHSSEERAAKRAGGADRSRTGCLTDLSNDVRVEKV
jgi:hypothetical protein